MGSEYFINSQELENKVRDLLPSQGGAGAGFDLSASTQIIPIIDLTESAEGSNLRQDLQSSLGFTTCTEFNVTNTTVTTAITTGYWRIVGNYTGLLDSSRFGAIIINDGTTDKLVWSVQGISDATPDIQTAVPFDIIVFVEAGHSVKIKGSATNTVMKGVFRQIASLDGTLTNP